MSDKATETVSHYPPNLIIENPGLLNRRERLFHTSLTILAWTLWTLLWLPLITQIGWLAQIWFTWHQMIDLNGFAAFLDLLATWGWALLILNMLFILWVIYNYYYFRNMNRRKPRPFIVMADIAVLHQKEESEIKGWWSAKRMVVDHHENGTIANIELK